MKQISTRSAPLRLHQVAYACTLTLAVIVLVSFLTPVRALSGGAWSVLSVSGDAEWRPAEVKVGGWQDLTTNSDIPDGAEIRTGGNGTAVVAKSLDRIEIRPNTSVVVAAKVAGETTQMYQASGSATYTVEKRPSGTFSVQTPYVIAVVKGTKFDVDISREETSVSVTEGRVAVSDRRSRDSVEVTPGEKARARADSSGLDVGNSSAAPAAPAKRAAAGNAPGVNGATVSGNATESSLSAASKGLDTATEAVSKTANGASSAAGNALGTAGSAVDDLGDTAGSAAGGLGEAVGGGNSGGASGGSSGSGGSSSGGSGSSGASADASGRASDSSGSSDSGLGGDAVGGLGEKAGGALGGLGGGLGGGGLGGKSRENR